MQFHWRLITHKSLKFWIVWSYNLNCEQETNLKYCNYGVTARGTISHSNNRWANINRRDLASSICIEFWMKLKLYYMGKWRGKKKKKKTSTHTEQQKHQLQGDIEANYIYINMFIKNKKKLYRWCEFQQQRRLWPGYDEMQPREAARVSNSGQHAGDLSVAALPIPLILSDFSPLFSVSTGK